MSAFLNMKSMIHRVLRNTRILGFAFDFRTAFVFGVGFRSGVDFGLPPALDPEFDFRRFAVGLLSEASRLALLAFGVRIPSDKGIPFYTFYRN